MMTTKTELQNKVKELQAQIDAMPDDKPKGRWKPERGELYFHFSSGGDVSCTRWYADGTDERRHALGNCFKTREAAKKHVENEKVHYELVDLADFTPDWSDVGEVKYYLAWKIKHAELYADRTVAFQLPNTAYFRTESDALAAVEKVGEKRVEVYLKGE